MTISDQLLLLNSTKTAIAAAIEDKGVAVGAVPFADYPAKIAEISGGGTPTPGWVRPADWLELPKVLEADQKFVGLHAVFSDANFLALKCTGGYTVDWGDGVVENFASGVQANHEYDFNNPALAASATALPYKQAIVTVTPQAGQNLTSLNLFVKHNQAGLVNGYASGWLDLRISGEFLATLTISGTSTTLVRHMLLEQVEILNSSVTNMSNMFYSCYALASIPMLDTSSVTNMSSMFYNCYALASIPALNTSSVTSISGMFYNCLNLSSINIISTKITHSIANCKLSAAALNAYYTNLPTVTGQTLTVTGNYGVSGDDPSIATAKGWTVAG